MSTALVVAHDVYGPDAHLRAMAEAVRGPGWTVSTPNFLPGGVVHPHDREAEAYRRFTDEVGVDAMARSLAAHAADLRTGHERVLCLGFGVGAAATWLASDAFDSIVCVYGSRIRDHIGHVPRVPCLAILAGHEPGSDPCEVAGQITGPTVAVEVVDAGHGFCDQDGLRHDPVRRAGVVRSARRFLHSG
ncbi:dienelactone hydrolase family protein [Actinosynnema sp. NPDC047251]|nr:dienelactone hydrolase family protein [Saccharothrix espanaensis]